MEEAFDSETAEVELMAAATELVEEVSVMIDELEAEGTGVIDEIEPLTLDNALLGIVTEASDFTELKAAVAPDLIELKATVASDLIELKTLVGVVFTDELVVLVESLALNQFFTDPKRDQSESAEAVAEEEEEEAETDFVFTLFFNLLFKRLVGGTTITRDG